MTSQTVLLDFTVSDNIDINLCEDIIKNFFDEKLSIDSSSGTLQLEFKNSGAKVDTVTYSGPGDLFMVIRVHHSSRLVTINIDGQSLCSSTGSLFKDGSINSSSSFIWQTQADLGNFVSSLARKLGTDKYNSLPSVTRGLEMTPYWTTTDDRIIECPIQSIVHDETSPYQRIQILDTIDFGRVLLLDGQTQLAESDDIYTKSLMSDVDYTGADILILGGGDGALLDQLLTKNPRMVTMVELDGAVMRVVREFMHSVTGGVLDKHEGEHYKIITGDAIKYLEDCVAENKQFDYIFGDLTDVPIDTDNEAKELWDFISKILKLGLSSVKTGGKYLTHVSGKAVPGVRDTLQDKVYLIAASLGREVDINFSEAFVPSFMETWVFAQVTLKTDSKV